MRRLLAGAVVVAMTPLTTGCWPGEEPGAPPSPSPGVAATATTQPVDCPKLEPTWIPDDLSLRERVSVPQGEEYVAERATYANEGATRELSFLSGVAGQVGEGLTARGSASVAGRGQVARLMTSGDTRAAVWREAPEDAPCHQYAVIALRLTREELREVLDALQ